MALKSKLSHFSPHSFFLSSFHDILNLLFNGGLSNENDNFTIGIVNCVMLVFNTYIEQLSDIWNHQMMQS
jgi:hypothetical protein